MRVRLLTAGLIAGALGAGAAGYTLAAEDEPASGAPARVEASIDRWRWAPSDELPSPSASDEEAEDAERPAIDGKPVPARDGEPAEDAPDAQEDETTQAERSEPESTSAAPGLPEPPKASGDSALVRAEVLENGVALPPLEAPPEVRAIFEAGNVIARSPYKWGGGHGKWQDTGYDCSGSVSYALAAAGLVTASMPSGGYMRWGKPGKGKWITIYANPGHMFMVVAGVRFDTVARGQTGSRWINSSTDTSGYVARHPPGF